MEVAVAEKKQTRSKTKKIVLLVVLVIIIVLSATAYHILWNYEFYQVKEVDLEPAAATYVLIPGAGHGAWSYNRVTEILEEAGQTVYSLTLPGLAERSDELTSDTDLNEHINDVVAYFENNDLQDVILVGHSYGGMVITGVADRIPNRVKHIVYLDAVHPLDGQNLLEAQPLTKYVDSVSEPRTINGVEVNLFPDDETIHFLGLKEKGDIEWAKQYLTPHPWKTFIQPLELQNPNTVEEIGKTDIYTKQQMVGLRLFRQIDKEEQDQAWVINTGHDLMITEPEIVANMLLNVATQIDD